MIAEIKHKLHSDLEDELTGNFFGNLRYLKFHDCLIPILCNSSSNMTNEMKNELKNEKFNEQDFEFWKTMENCEIDAFFSNKKYAIGIEAKLYSGKSGVNQLEKESRAINKEYSERKKVLFFITKDNDSALKSYWEDRKNADHITWICYGAHGNKCLLNCIK